MSPHRTAPSKATVWQVAVARGPTTRLERARSTGGGLLVFMVVAVAAVVASLLGLRFGFPLSALVVVAVTAWPLPRERLWIGPDRVRWKDRLFGNRYRAATAETRLEKRHAGAESALMLVSSKSQQLLATGTPQDIEALAVELDAALHRASAAS